MPIVLFLLLFGVELKRNDLQLITFIPDFHGDQGHPV